MSSISSGCPTCGAKHTNHDRRPGEAPVNGDVSLCFHCKSPAIFVDVLGALALRQPTAEELAALQADEEFLRVKAASSTAVNPEQAIAVTWGSS